MDQGMKSGNGAVEQDPRAKMQEMARQAGAQMEHARVVLDDFNERAKAFIRERPGTAILGAIAVGYLIGKLASRR